MCVYHLALGLYLSHSLEPVWSLSLSGEELDVLCGAAFKWQQEVQICYLYCVSDLRSCACPQPTADYGMTALLQVWPAGCCGPWVVGCGP